VAKREESEFVVPGASARYLGLQAAGGRRRGRLLGARRLPGQPVYAVLAGAVRRNHRGRTERCWAPGGTAGSPSSAPRTRSALGSEDYHPARRQHAPLGLARPGPAHLPGASAGGDSARSAPPAATSRAIARRDCQPPPQGGRPWLALGGERRAGGGWAGLRGHAGSEGGGGGRGSAHPSGSWSRARSSAGPE
jgi:hypothetical protein